MLTTISNARRRALVVTVVALCVLLVSKSSSSAAPLRDVVRTTVVGDTNGGNDSTYVPDDTAKIHGRLRRSINRFEDTWRQTWQRYEPFRHDHLDLSAIRGWVSQSNGEILVPPSPWPGLRTMDDLTPALRRYLATLCIVETPTDAEIEYFKRPLDASRPPPSKGGMSWATHHQIVPRPAFGNTCPIWTPAVEGVPLDEGESIDLALNEELRAPIRMSRDSLIRTLDSARTQYPSDSWIVGQHFRFVYDQASPERSIVAARSCKVSEGFCSSLAGMAFEQAGDYAAAEAAYREAEELNGPGKPVIDEERAMKLCVDPDAMLIIDHNDRDNFRDVPCNEQRKLMDRLWWMSDPLWSVPGNERYVQHNTRRLHIALRAIDERDERYVWERKGGGDGVRELVIRYGWPTHTYWNGGQLDLEITKMRLNPKWKHLWPTHPPYTVKEYAPDRTALVPIGKAFLDPFNLSEIHWNIYSPSPDIDTWWPQEHMAYHTHLSWMSEGQEVMWRRDTNVVYQLAVDDPLRNLDTATTAPSRAFLMGGDAPATTRTLAQSFVGEGHTLRLLTQLKSQPIVMSAEILPRTGLEQAQRRRYGVHPPPTLREMKANEVALSDPVIMRMPNRAMPVPTDQASVLRYMAGGLEFPKEEPLAIYWESYGFIFGDTVQFELKFRRDDNRNAARVVGGLLGMVSDLRDSVSIKWSEPDNRHSAVALAASKPTVGRSLAIDLNALDPGTYVVSIEMRKSATVFARSERRFVVTKP